MFMPLRKIHESRRYYRQAEGNLPWQSEPRLNLSCPKQMSVDNFPFFTTKSKDLPKYFRFRHIALEHHLLENAPLLLQSSVVKSRAPILSCLSCSSTFVFPRTCRMQKDANNCKHYILCRHSLYICIACCSRSLINHIALLTSSIFL